MKKKTIKLCITMLIVAITVLIITNKVFAIDGIVDSLKPQGSASTGSSEVDTLIKEILGYIKFFAIGIAVAAVIYLGIVLIMSEDPDVKANIKKSCVLLIGGCIFIFIPAQIVEIVINITKNVQ